MLKNKIIKMGGYCPCCGECDCCPCVESLDITITMPTACGAGEVTRTLGMTPDDTTGECKVTGGEGGVVDCPNAPPGSEISASFVASIYCLNGARRLRVELTLDGIPIDGGGTTSMDIITDVPLDGCSKEDLTLSGVEPTECEGSFPGWEQWCNGVSLSTKPNMKETPECQPPCDCCPCLAGFIMRLKAPSACGTNLFETRTVMGTPGTEGGTCRFDGEEGGVVHCTTADVYLSITLGFKLYCSGGERRLYLFATIYRPVALGGGPSQTLVVVDIPLEGCEPEDLTFQDLVPTGCTGSGAGWEQMCEGVTFSVEPIIDGNDPLCTECRYVKELHGTGTPDSGTSADGEGHICATDKYWKANGSPARIVSIDFPYGCPDNSWIGSLCDAESSDSGTNGGPDGSEIIFKTEFIIEPDADLDRILISGEYSADNYVKAGCWKVNGSDQCQIYHGTYNNRLAIDCVAFDITNVNGHFVHGTNTVEITVKNGHWGSGAMYGGQQPFTLKWACFDLQAVVDDPPTDCITEPDDSTTALTDEAQ